MPLRVRIWTHSLRSTWYGGASCAKPNRKRRALRLDVGYVEVTGSLGHHSDDRPTLQVAGCSRRPCLPHDFQFGGVGRGSVPTAHPCTRATASCGISSLSSPSFLPINLTVRMIASSAFKTPRHETFPAQLLRLQDGPTHINRSIWAGPGVIRITITSTICARRYLSFMLGDGCFFFSSPGVSSWQGPTGKRGRQRKSPGPANNTLKSTPPPKDCSPVGVVFSWSDSDSIPRFSSQLRRRLSWEEMGYSTPSHKLSHASPGHYLILPALSGLVSTER